MYAIGVITQNAWTYDPLTQETPTNNIKTAYWIAFGPHGPRAGDPPGEGRKVLLYTIIGSLAGVGIFGLTHLFAGPHPSTMNREWQEATNEYFKVWLIDITFPKGLRLAQKLTHSHHRKTRSSPSPACRPKAM